MGLHGLVYVYEELILQQNSVKFLKDLAIDFVIYLQASEIDEDGGAGEEEDLDEEDLGEEEEDGLEDEEDEEVSSRG